jgi:hypothetical protein
MLNDRPGSAARKGVGLWRLAIILLLSGVCPGAAGWAQTSGPGQDIQIVRPAANSATEVTSDQVDLELEITAFSPILEVRINDDAQVMPKSNWLVVKKTYPLKPGANRIVVQVKTATETTTREIVIEKREEGAKQAAEAGKAEPFSFVGGAGMQSVSNPLHMTSGAKSGMRTFFLAIPTYSLELDSGATLRMQAIASRDMYDSSLLKGAEVEFTQVSAAHVTRLSDGTLRTFGLGINAIDLGFDNPISGKVRMQQDLFVFGALGGAGESGPYEYGLELRSQDVNSPPGDFNDDAMVITARGQGEGELGSFHSRMRGLFSMVNATGKYQSRNILRFNYDLTIPYAKLFERPAEGEPSRMIVGGGVRLRKEDYGTKDPGLGKAPANTLIGLALNAAYPLEKAWIIMGELLQETQSSNVKTSAYDNTSIMAMVIYAY